MTLLVNEPLASSDVLVRTRDGDVPLEQISQGMSSLFGWIGTTIRRLYEVNPDSEHPEQEPALLLVDEVDAHLHPEWQQRLIETLKKHFPAAQIIATTHSPLVVAGLDREEVMIARRDERGVPFFDPAPLDFKEMRADQILTSPLFGLVTTRSSGAVSEINRYSALIGKADLDERERAERDDLHAKLSSSLKIGETELERRVESALVQTLDTETDARTVHGRLDHAHRLELKRQIESLGDGSAPVEQPRRSTQFAKKAPKRA